MRWLIHQRTRSCAAIVLCSLLALFALASCHSGNSNNNSAAAASRSARALLQHMPTGMASLTWNQQKHTLDVKIAMTGLAPNSQHPVHIHEGGTCTKEGKTLYDLPNVKANAHGVASLTTSVSNVQSGIPAHGWYIIVHNGVGHAAVDDTPIACGSVTNRLAQPGKQQSVEVQLAGTQAPNQEAHGEAQFTLAGGTLTVQLTMSGLQPNSQHMAHIHSGSCASQGAVVYPLPVLKADAHGQASVTATFKNVSAIPASGWYVNVHLTTNMTTTTGDDPIACGDVTTH